MKTVLAFLAVLCSVHGHDLQGKTLKITSTVHAPYVMMRDESNYSTNHDKRYEGYMIDLLDELSTKLNFTYQINMEIMYGSMDDKGKWNGMMESVISGQVDMAASDITITAIREKFVDFTYPFLTGGITIVYKKPDEGTPLPFHNSEGLEVLATQGKIDVGAYGFGSTMAWFKKTKIPHLHRIGNLLQSNIDALPKGNWDGIEMVKRRNGSFAFFLESGSAKYQVERNCDLIQVGGQLDTRAHGLALKQGSPYREPINVALLELQEDGFLQKIETKWFKQKRGGGACTTTTSDSWNYNTNQIQPTFMEKMSNLFL